MPLLKEHAMRSTQFYLLVGSLLAASPGIAQTAASGSAPAASSPGGMGWLWIVVLVVAVGGAIWYFFIRNKRSVTSSTGVDRDRVAGSAEYAKGSVKDTVGNVLGDTKLKAEGKLDKAQGRTQNTVGGIKDTLKGK
jgi:uncharacterized protein YjbJ (UPF0337 family)